MKPTIKKLKNGLPVILIPQDGAASMTLMVFVRVGSRYETRSINGASHFVEHLMFKGTHKRPDTLSISKELDRYGAEYNAYTGKDLTCYYIKMDAAQTPLAVDMLHDMLFNSRYDATEIERERGVIIEEINMYEDNPRMHIEDLMEGVLFPGNTLGWNIAGPREVIRQVTRDQLVHYRDSYYIPSRLAIAMAGKVDAGALKLLNDTFGTVKEPARRADKSFAPFVPPAKLAQPLAWQNKKTEQIQLGLAFHGLGLKDKDRHAAGLLANILGGTMSSRLFIQVRERRGLCYSIHASHQCLEDTGVFNVMAGLEKTRLPEAVKVIRQELDNTAKEKITAEELRRAKDHIRGKLTLAFEDSSSQADWYGKQWIFQHELRTPDERLREIERITAANLQRVARRIFRPRHLAAAVIGPFGRRQELTRLFR